MRKLFTSLSLVLCLAIQARAASPAQSAIASSTAPSSTAAPTSPASAAQVASPAVARNVWPQDSSDLKADPEIVFGKLDNGLRYVIYPSKTFSGRAHLELMIRAGSLMEADDQRGMAHFLEHMAFNGTKHFPAGEMVEYFQHLGMSFGAHTNANTTMERTVYKLDLPRTDERVVGDGLKWFRDILDGMTLDKKEIERERRVILAEIMASATPDYRAETGWLASLMPESTIPRRLVLGDVKSVNSLVPGRFADFHDTWYTPGRTVIVAAGDFNVKDLEAMIRQKFQDAKAVRGEQPDLPRGKVVAGQEPVATMHADRDATTVAVKMSVVRPTSGQHDSVTYRREKTAHYMVIAMLNARLARKAAENNSTFQSAGTVSEKLFGVAEANHIIGNCKVADWQATIGSLEQEMRRAMTYGFTDAEFAEAKGLFLSVFQAAADQSATRETTKIADDVVESLLTSDVLTSASADLALTKSVFSTLTKADCQQAMSNFWNPRNVRIWVEGNVQVSDTGSEQILAAYRASRATPIQADAEQKSASFAYTNFGPAGQIVKRTEQKDFDFVQAVFANNVHVNVKRTINEKSAVQVLVRFGGGLLEVPANRPELRQFAYTAFFGGGLQKHSVVELNRVLRDKQCSVVFAIGEDAFEFGGSCASASLETELQVCAAYLSAPGFRPESRKQFLDALEGVLAENLHTPIGAIRCSGATFLHSGDVRFGFPSIEALQAVSLDDLKNWMAKPLAEGYLEMTIVGDVDPEAALQLAAKTLGALPQRAAAKPEFAKERDVRYPVGAKTKTLSFSSADPLALSAVSWPTLGRRNVKYDRCVSVLGDVLNDRLRLKIRQELGATYTPAVICNSSDVFTDYGMVLAIMTVDARKANEVGLLVRKIAADMAAGSISDDEFQRAIKPTLSSFAVENRDNNHWVGVLSQSQEHPFTLENARSREADYRSITKADLETLAKQLFVAEKATVINVVPTPETVAVK